LQPRKYLADAIIENRKSNADTANSLTESKIKIKLQEQNPKNDIESEWRSSFEEPIKYRHHEPL